MWQKRCGDSRALSFQLKLLGGQIPALKEFCPFVPVVPTPALRGSRSVTGRGLGTGPGWQRSVRATQLALLQLWDQMVRLHVLSPGPESMPSPRPPACPLKERRLTLSPLQKQCQGRREAALRTPGRRSALPPTGKTDVGLMKGRQGGAGLAGGERGRDRERQAPRRERTRPPRGPSRRREKEVAGERGQDGTYSLARGS